MTSPSSSLCSRLVVLGYLILSALPTRASELKVDINRDVKNFDSVTAIGYTKWSQGTTAGATSGTAAAAKTFTNCNGGNGHD